MSLQDAVGRLRRPAPALEGPGLRHGRRPGRAGLPALRPEVPRLRALDRLLPGDRQGLDGGHPRHRLPPLGRPGRPRHAPLRPRPPRPPARPRALLLARARAEPARPRARRPAPVLMASSSTYVLGISCFYHDSAAALLKDGVVIAAGQEERFSRKKHDSGFPIGPSSTCCTRPASGPTSSTRSASTTSRSSSSSGCSRPTSPPSRGPSTPSARRCRSGCTRSSGCPRSSARSSSPTRGRSSSPSTT